MKTENKKYLRNEITKKMKRLSDKHKKFSFIIYVSSCSLEMI